MPLVGRRRVPFPLEHMPQMPPAVGAQYLRPRHAERLVRVAHDGPGDAVKVRGPAAARLELVRRFVERGVASEKGK